MKKTRFTAEQMVTILREADEKPVPEVAKKHRSCGDRLTNLGCGRFPALDVLVSRDAMSFSCRPA